MSTRSRAAAVLARLAVGAGVLGMAVVYTLAADDVQAPVPEVAAESQEEAIEAAAELRRMGLSPVEAADSIAKHTRAPVAAVRALVGDRRKAARDDERQRMGRVGVIAYPEAEQAVEAAIVDVMCEPLVDPRGQQDHDLLDACRAFWRDALQRIYCSGGNPVGTGAQWSALPSQRRDLAAAVQQAGGLFVGDPDDVSEAFGALLENEGWGECPEETP